MVYFFSRFISLVVLFLLLSSCTGLPDKVIPVKNFNLQQYLGTWYEIARLDHSFERGLEQVTASYSIREDGGVRVINKGFSTDNQEWKEAEGKAYFLGEDDIAHLKVSFFGPFYGSYAIFELDKDEYQYAFISGNSTEYLWFLARTPNVDSSLIALFEESAEELGFDISQLIYVNQN